MRGKRVREDSVEHGDKGNDSCEMRMLCPVRAKGRQERRLCKGPE